MLSWETEGGGHEHVRNGETVTRSSGHRVSGDGRLFGNAFSIERAACGYLESNRITLESISSVVGNRDSAGAYWSLVCDSLIPFAQGRAGRTLEIGYTPLLQDDACPLGY